MKTPKGSNHYYVLINEKRSLYETIMNDVAKIVKRHLNEMDDDGILSEQDVIDKYSLTFTQYDGSEIPKLVWLNDILYYDNTNGHIKWVDYDDEDEYCSPDLDDEYMINGFCCRDGVLYMHSAADHEIRFSKFSDEFKEEFLFYVSDEDNIEIGDYS